MFPWRQQIIAGFGQFWDASQMLLSWMRRLLCERGSRNPGLCLDWVLCSGSVPWVDVPQSFEPGREMGEGCHIFLMKHLLETGSTSSTFHGQVGRAPEQQLESEAESL